MFCYVKSDSGKIKPSQDYLPPTQKNEKKWWTQMKENKSLASSRLNAQLLETRFAEKTKKKEFAKKDRVQFWNMFRLKCQQHSCKIELWNNLFVVCFIKKRINFARVWVFYKQSELRITKSCINFSAAFSFNSENENLQSRKFWYFKELKTLEFSTGNWQGSIHCHSKFGILTNTKRLPDSR